MNFSGTVAYGLSSVDLAPIPAYPDMDAELKEQSEEFIDILVSRSAMSTPPDAALSSAASSAGGPGGPALVPPSGNEKALVLLVDFSDTPFSVNATFFDDLIFSDDPGEKSVRNYYREISYGNVDVVPVDLPSDLGWYRMPNLLSYYGGGAYGLGSYPQNAQKMVEDAVDAADPFVDFSVYDSDSDGVVDNLFVVHAGNGAEVSGDPDDIWSHKWGIWPRSKDGVVISSYSMEPEKYSTGNVTRGVFAHELGHVFGLSDLYDLDGDSRGLGRWSLMASGSWNGSLGDMPAHPDAWSMVKLGFVTPVEVTSSMAAATLNAIANTPTNSLYKITVPGTGGQEYFLIENRQPIGTDANLPGSGILIYHIDETKANNNDQSHYKVDIEEAHGGTQHLSANSNYGDAGDPYPGTSNNRAFSDLTDPNSNSYASQIVDISVANISNNGAVMTLDFIDSNAPFTSLSSTPAAPDGLNNWFISTPTITLTPNETADTFYAWDTTASFSTYSTPLSSPVGSHTLYYYSRDPQSNTEIIRSQQFKVDLTDPTNVTSVSELSGTSQFIIQKLAAPTNFEWSGASDGSGSGVSYYNVYLGLDPNGTSAPLLSSSNYSAPSAQAGYNFFRIQAVDDAGNGSPWQTFYELNLLDSSFNQSLAWNSGVGNWDGNGNKIAIGDFNGDGNDDIVSFYGYFDTRETRAWVWLNNGIGGFNSPVLWWNSGPNNWDWEGTKLDVGDFDNNGTDDILAFYGYQVEAQTRAFVFNSTGSSFNSPAIWWDSGAGNWDWEGTKIDVGDFDNNGTDDILAFYGYANERQARAFVFDSTGSSFNSPAIWWNSGPNNWDWFATKIDVGDYDDDGDDDLSALYNYDAQNQVRAFMFKSGGSSFTSPGVWWDSGAGNWDWDATKLSGGDYNNDDKDDLLTLYGYGNNQTIARAHFSNGTSFASPLAWWDSGINGWTWNSSEIFSGDFVGSDSLEEFIGFYDYGGSHSAIHLFE